MASVPFQISSIAFKHLSAWYVAHMTGTTTNKFWLCRWSVLFNVSWFHWHMYEVFLYLLLYFPPHKYITVPISVETVVMWFAASHKKKINGGLWCRTVICLKFCLCATKTTLKRKCEKVLTHQLIRTKENAAWKHIEKQNKVYKQYSYIEINIKQFNQT